MAALGDESLQNRQTVHVRQLQVDDVRVVSARSRTRETGRARCCAFDSEPLQPKKADGGVIDEIVNPEDRQRVPCQALGTVDGAALFSVRRLGAWVGLN